MMERFKLKYSILKIQKQVDFLENFQWSKTRLYSPKSIAQLKIAIWVLTSYEKIWLSRPKSALKQENELSLDNNESQVLFTRETQNAKLFRILNKNLPA
jgi:hypothetical protein